ncbi:MULTISPECIES: FAD-binding oxidoreductase [Kitasatospora]|uniref:FAD-binding protein n=1 Tax=Kitasatospora cathayae TaxID=3004092 RepID=A0ABY7Q6K0_9ACTN|nr:FAD-binding protein [Kitasatospora sp. HUAS 3-15]WBP88274.1 FAD-binding protein [Kitasatospora sp. HUAS 3-15]
MIRRRSVLEATAAAIALTALDPKGVFADTACPQWSRLASSLQGQLVLPSSANYGTAKQLDLMQYDIINPRAIAYCASPADAAACLRFAQSNAMPFSVRSGGHSLGGYSTTPGLVIDVSGLNSVTVSGTSATIGPGAELVDITNGLAPAGLALAGGMCPTVAAGGYLQGGGIGMLTRPLGLGCDSITSAQVVLADGSQVTASASQNSDLLWALKGGGGGNFGIVTSYTVQPTALTQLAVASLTWSYDHAVDTLDGFTRWLVSAPRTISGAVSINLDDAAATNTPTVAVLLVSAGTTTELNSEVTRLISMIATPTGQQTSVVPYQALMMGFYGCATDTVAQCHRIGATSQGVLPRHPFGVERNRMFSGPVDRSVWEAAVAVFDTGRQAGPSYRLQVIALGGAVNDLSRTQTAYVHRDSLYLVNYVGSVATAPVADTTAAAARQWATTGFNAISPYSNGESYQNFIDPALTDWRTAYYAENYPKLAAIKAKYDPYGAFSFAQSIS